MLYHEFYWGWIKEGGKCMKATSSGVTWSTCSSYADAAQAWRFDTQTLEIRNLEQPSGGPGGRGCLTISGGDLSLEVCNGAEDQKFYPTDESGKTQIYSLQNKKCINRVSGSDNAQYVTSNCLGYSVSQQGLPNNQWSSFKYMKDYTMVNVALNARTYQSTTGWGGLSYRAVDGNVANDWWGYSTHTGEQGAAPVSWSVDLGRDYKVEIITIYNSLDSERDQGPNIDGAKVYLNATLCATISHVTGQVKYEVKCSGNDANGRIIKIESVGGKNLTLVEVEVMSAEEPRFTVENTHITNKAQTSTLTIYREEVKGDLDYTCTIAVEGADFTKKIKEQPSLLTPTTTEVQEGQKATLTCKAEHLKDTNAKIKWVKDNAENTYTAQDSSSGYRVITSSSSSAGVMTTKLVIDEANTKQDGVHTCMFQVRIRSNYLFFVQFIQYVMIDAYMSNIYTSWFIL